ncbi:MAG: chloride channel protein [Chloroflexota bacterium]|nr:chloride channel protein [Chloroflexota bacterium]
MGFFIRSVRRLLSIIRSSEMATGIILSIGVGVIAGLGAVGFRYLIEAFQKVFFVYCADWFSFLGDYYVIILPVLGGLLFGPLVYFLAREAKGEGPPEVMEAVLVRGGRIRAIVAPIKVLASSLCISSGGSVGREGPIVQIGASAGSTIGEWLRLPEYWMKTLVLCGAAGGVAATFNAPIGGVLFALEVLQRRFIVPHMGFILISAVAAEFAAYPFLGDSPSFIIPGYEMTSNWEMLAFVLLGIMAGWLSIMFIRIFFFTEALFSHVRIPGYLKPACGGLLIGVTGFFFPEVFGVGYGEIEGLGGSFTNLSRGPVDMVLANQPLNRDLVGGLTITGLQLMFILVFVKIFATSITLGSGGSGGVFAPSLFIGAMLGGVVGTVANETSPGLVGPAGAFALVGMGAFFAATVQGPFTAIIILFEMTRDYDLILPLMVAVVASTLVARAISRESIYTMRLVRRGVDIHRQEHADIMRDVTVGEVMTRGFPSVLPTMLVSDLAEEFRQKEHHGFPVVDEYGQLFGIVTLHDIERFIDPRNPNMTVADIATKTPIVAYPDQSVHDAIRQLGGQEVGRIPVVDRDNPKKLLGVLRRYDIIKAYTRALANQKEQD